MHSSRSKSNQSCTIWDSLARELFIIKNRKTEKDKRRYLDLRVIIPYFHLNPERSIKQITFK